MSNHLASGTPEDGPVRGRQEACWQPSSRVALLLAALAASCRDVGPCEGVVGTCLTVRLQVGDGRGERVDAIQFAVEGDGAFRHSDRLTIAGGGQLLPITAPLPLPDAAQRTIKIHASGELAGKLLLQGSRVVADLRPGDHRGVVLTMTALRGGDNGSNDHGNDEAPTCSDGKQNGSETGVDCGGGCAPCAPPMSSCQNGRRDGAETDIDCGGGTCGPCHGGQACQAPADCVSGRCEGAACVRALTLTGITPESGPTQGGTVVTLRGEALASDMEVLFGAAPATILRVDGDGRSAVVAAPAAAAGPVTVTARRGADSASLPSGFAYHYGTLRFGTMPPTTYAPGNKPYFLIGAQLNPLGDSRQDIAVVNEIDSTVGIWLGKGDGTFDRGPVYRVGRRDGAYPLMVAAGDLNGDGRLDLATADNRQPTVSTLLSNGDGTFRPAASYDLPMGMDRAFSPSIALGDLNGDMLADLVATDARNGGLTYVLLASPDRSGTLLGAQLVPGTDVAVSEADSVVALGRIDGDTRLDLAVATAARRTARVFLGNGDGTFRPAGEAALGGVGTFTLALLDLSGDGRTDLLSANRGSDNVSVLLGNGDGTFQSARTTRTSAGPYTLAVADYDGDGRLDLALPCYRDVRPEGTVIALLLGDGRGAFPRSAELFAPHSAFGVAAGDWDGDGKTDLAAASVAPSNLLTILVNRSM